jgi:hypothetical protein
VQSTDTYKIDSQKSRFDLFTLFIMAIIHHVTNNIIIITAQGTVSTTPRKSRTFPCTMIAITMVVFAIILARRVLRQPKTPDASTKAQYGERMYGPTLMGVFKHKAHPQGTW